MWRKLLAIFKTTGIIAGKVAIAEAPAAAAQFGGPIAGGLVQSLFDTIHAQAAAGINPNAELLKQSIGQLIEGAIGLLQATGKLPKVAAVPATTFQSQLFTTPSQTITDLGATGVPGTGTQPK